MNYGDLIGTRSGSRSATATCGSSASSWRHGHQLRGQRPRGGSNFNFDDFRRSAPVSPGSRPRWGRDLSETVLILGIVVVVLIIALFFIVLAIISQGALADSVAAIDRGQGRRFGSAFRRG